MAKVEIIGMPQSTFVRVVRMTCEEKGVSYELTAARPHSAEINAVDPFGKVPGMRHGDVELCESKAIATYLDRTFGGPKVIPEDPARAAHVEQWVSIVNTTIDPTMIRQYLLSYLFPKGADGKPDRKAIDAALPAMQQQFDVLDKAVAGTGYLAGSSFTLADINLLPILAYIQRPPESSEMFKKSENLSAYFAKHAERPSFKNTTPPPPPSQ
ncbi:MAG: glutathione S-transferase family protein [Hyphomicrobiales bacterium]|nr:glutathione S-transferase family protein [Hyphomicrobiales bacterium]MBV8827496.1 glutathione S-transferase family protein [Hyphomicrobiales bacterium]MBV9428611.1 glutathione S-transferase family protein [Bradyrhizobiaceae bacterium]